MSNITKIRVMLDSNGNPVMDPITVERSSLDLLESYIYEKQKELMIQANEEIQNPEEK